MMAGPASIINAAAAIQVANWNLTVVMESLTLVAASNATMGSTLAAMVTARPIVL